MVITRMEVLALMPSFQALESCVDGCFQDAWLTVHCIIGGFRPIFKCVPTLGPLFFLLTYPVLNECFFPHFSLLCHPVHSEVCFHRGV